ncbi:MAG TPA: hypothetical protein H9866_04730 [Candidatus Tidjanibacter gallistercoris]|nr:hypothetical protein [Candidatus Tidjanibacter gallistercoris]
MVKRNYVAPQVEALVVRCEAGIALSYGEEGAAGSDLRVDDTDLNW